MADEVTRHSVLESRHRALGSDLGEWNGMDVAWEYASPDYSSSCLICLAGMVQASEIAYDFGV